MAHGNRAKLAAKARGKGRSIMTIYGKRGAGDIDTGTTKITPGGKKRKPGKGAKAARELLGSEESNAKLIRKMKGAGKKGIRSDDITQQAKKGPTFAKSKKQKKPSKDDESSGDILRREKDKMDKIIPDDLFKIPKAVPPKKGSKSKK